MITLVLGGVRSGKSKLAETLAMQSGDPVTYIATAGADDDSMVERINKHRARRPHDWGIIEEKIHLAQAIDSLPGENHCVLVDCLSLWLTNLLLNDDSGLIDAEIDALIQCLSAGRRNIILVSSESNMGVVPLGELSRRYCDLIGETHQRVAAESDRVIFTVAGLPHILKGDKL